MKKKSGISTAYHEAGHAVACYLLHHRFKKATIIPNEDEDSLGHIERKGLTKDPNITYYYQRDNIEKDVLILLAGESAEARYLGHHNWSGASQDTRSAMDLLENLAPEPTGEECYAYFRLMSCRAKTLWLDSIPGGQHRWNAVKALAEALLVKDTLGYREAREIIKAVIDQPISEEEMTRSEEALARLLASVKTKIAAKEAEADR